MLIYILGISKVNLALITNNYYISFPNIKLIIVVSITRIIPFRPEGKEIFLSNIIISKGVI